MATNINWWRASRTIFGPLGEKTFFVDWDFGHDDSLADGSPEHPFATISHGYKLLVSRGYTPVGCVVRGHGNEAFVGNHSFTVQGDYWGAAIYDGGGTSQIIYCTMKNIIYLNGGTNIDVDYSVSPYGDSIRAAFAGCGRAYSAGCATDAYYVFGVASSPILIGNSKMYRGCIGGTQSTSYNIYAKIKCTPYATNKNTCGVTFGGYQLSPTATIGNCVVYDLPLQERALNKSAQTVALHAYRWIFSKVDFIYEHADYFYQCLFTSDCRMFIVDKTTNNVYSGKRLKVIPVNSEDETLISYNPDDKDQDFTGEYTAGSLIVSGKDINNIYDALVALFRNGNTTLDPSTYFKEDCVFTEQTAEDVFNAPEQYDFTTKLDSAAYISVYHYFGALPPSLNIPILGTGNSGSDGVAGCWDNRSIDGCLKVENGNVKIDTASTEKAGRILTKIIKTDPFSVQYNGLFSMLTRRVKNGWIASKINPFGPPIKVDSSLKVTLEPNTQYLIKDSKATFNGDFYNPNGVIDTTNSNTLEVVFENEEGYLLPIIDANIPDTLYCRCRSMIYARTPYGEVLKPQITYLNDGDRPIGFHGRLIYPNESFICDIAEAFIVYNENGEIDTTVKDYSLAIIFDDREVIPDGEERIGGLVEFIPAQKFGEYFAMKNAGAITSLEIPQVGIVPKSSGNYQCFTKNGGGTQINGYKSIFNQTYIQFALYVTVVSELDVNQE